MVKRKKPKAAGNQIAKFVLGVASGDMPTETVIRADKGKTPQRTRFAEWEKSKARRLAPRGQRSGAKSGVADGEEPQGRDLTVMQLGELPPCLTPSGTIPARLQPCRLCDVLPFNA